MRRSRTTVAFAVAALALTACGGDRWPPRAPATSPTADGCPSPPATPPVSTTSLGGGYAELISKDLRLPGDRRGHRRVRGEHPADRARRFRHRLHPCRHGRRRRRATAHSASPSRSERWPGSTSTTRRSWSVPVLGHRSPTCEGSASLPAHRTPVPRTSRCGCSKRRRHQPRAEVKRRPVLAGNRPGDEGRHAGRHVLLRRRPDRGRHRPHHQPRRQGDLPIEGRLLGRLQTEHGQVYQAATLSKDAYKTAIDGTPPSPVPNLLIVSGQMPDALAREPDPGSCSSTRRPSPRSTQKETTSNKTDGPKTEPVPLHPGAERYYGGS